MKFLINKLLTIANLFNFFLSPKRAIFIPLIVVLLVVAFLLIATNGVSMVAPFVYTLF